MLPVTCFGFAGDDSKKGCFAASHLYLCFLDSCLIFMEDNRDAVSNEIGNCVQYFLTFILCIIFIGIRINREGRR